MQYFNEHIDVLPAEQRKQYVDGARALKKPVVTGDFLGPKIMEFFRELLGRPLINIYGATEMGVVIATTDDCNSNLEVSLPLVSNLSWLMIGSGALGSHGTKCR